MPEDLVIQPDNIGLVAFGLVFAAGLLSFLSPCVLPLVPAYIGYLSGATVSADGVQDSERKAFKHAVAFVGGFGVLFVAAAAVVGLFLALVSLFSAGSDAGSDVVGDLSFFLPRLLARVGAVLLAVMAVRVADTRLNGDWRVKLGRVELDWPGSVARVPQGYVRWGLIGLVVAVFTRWLSFIPEPLQTYDAAMLGVAVLTGAGPSVAAAAVLGLAVAGLNSVRMLHENSFIPQIYVLPQAIALFLVVFYVSRTNLFYQEKRLQLGGRFQNKGYMTSGIMGAVFAAGWTPCTGPNLAVALAVAGSANTAVTGTALLSTYALGLGIPFLIVGYAFGSATRVMRRMTRYMHIIKAVNTVLLLIMAALVLSEALVLLSGQSNFISDYFNLEL